MDVATRLKALREDRGLNVNELAKRAGISQSFMRALELGQKQPTVSTLQKVCTALNITLSEFFSDGPTTQIPDHLKELMESSRNLTPEQSKKLAEFLGSL